MYKLLTLPLIALSFLLTGCITTPDPEYDLRISSFATKDLMISEFERIDYDLPEMEEAVNSIHLLVWDIQDNRPGLEDAKKTLTSHLEDYPSETSEAIEKALSSGFNKWQSFLNKHPDYDRETVSYRFLGKIRSGISTGQLNAYL